MPLSSTVIDSNVNYVKVFEAGQDEAITGIILCNVTPSTNAAVTIYMVPATKTIGINTMVFNGLPLPAGETFAFDTERFILGVGDAVYVTATAANAVVCTISHIGL